MEINSYNANSVASTANSSVSSSSSSLEMDDFLNLLVAQMKNQDAMSPMDNTAFVAQLAQFSSLQAMNNLADISGQAQATSLIGKTVIMAAYDSSGNLVTTEGEVEKVTIYGGKTNLYVNGEEFELSNVMEIKKDQSTDENKSVLENILEELININSPMVDENTITSE